MTKIILFSKSMRMEQWIKNIFIFAPVIFSFHFFQKDYLTNTFAAFFLFSLVASCVYIFNDCFDKKKDRLHPEKKKRPIASGALAVSEAYSVALVLLAVVLFGIFKFNREFFFIAVVYVVLNLFYSFYLKKIVILDVMIIAVGFVLRVKIGGAVNNIALSPWILIITFLVAIFLGLIKRRQELVKMQKNLDKSDIKTRMTLNKYNFSLLDQLISVSTATTLISYIIYVSDHDVLEKFGTNELYITVPFVAFGLFRYLYLTYNEGKGENPVEIIFADLPFSFNILLWLALFLILIE